MKAKSILLSIVLLALLLGGISHFNLFGYPAPKWLLIEYPLAGDNMTLRFPGVRAVNYQQCLEQAKMVLEKLGRTNRMQCASNCRFSVDWGSPLCDETVELDANKMRLAN